MAFVCPAGQEARVEYLGGTDDAKSRLRCSWCEHEWTHGGEQPAPKSGVLTYKQAKAGFAGASSVSPEAAARVDRL